MTKAKYLLVILFISIILFFVPSICHATGVSVTRDIYANNGSMKFNFKGLTLDKTHEYEFGLTKTSAASVENWYLITEYSESTATINLIPTYANLRDIINAVDTGYISIKDKTTDSIVLPAYSVDLKTPYLSLTNYTVIPNGKEFNTDSSSCIQVALRDAKNSKAYYQYEKITDQTIIAKYKELKSQNGDFSTLGNILKTTVPTSNWLSWSYWNGHSPEGTDGFGYPQSTISVPDSGLYYMWIYFSGINVKNVYGYILVDNLTPDIALGSISLSATQTIKLGDTLTLSPVFNPSNATNKIVTWSSSDESVATVDNSGKITAKKVGSTIITVVSQDGNKRATCTVTVVKASNSNQGNNNSNNSNTGNSGVTNNGGSSNGNTSNNQKDTTISSGKLPQTGVGFGLILTIILFAGISAFAYFKYSDLKKI